MDVSCCHCKFGARRGNEHPVSYPTSPCPSWTDAAKAVSKAIAQNSQETYPEKVVNGRRNHRTDYNTHASVALKTIVEDETLSDFYDMDPQTLEAIEIEDKLSERVTKKKKPKLKGFRYYKMRFINDFTSIVLMMTLLNVMIDIDVGAVPINKPALFNKNERMDKLIMKNQIGYHFKKVVREVSQELFVSRKIDVSTLFLGVQVFKQTSEDLNKYCSRLNRGNIKIKDSKDSIDSAPQISEYVLIEYPQRASFAEAKARCEARQMQLPEVYSLPEHDRLNTFLKSKQIPKCFAGLIPDLGDSTFRFISTGAAIWRTPHKELFNVNGAKYQISTTMDDYHVKFMYGDDSKLYVRFINPHPKIGDESFRNDNKDFPQVVAPIVCQLKWDGYTYDHFKSDNREVYGIKVKSYTKRATEYRESEYPNKVPTDKTKVLREYCTSIASRASDLYNELSTKLKNLLALVDISVHLENSEIQRTRKDLHENDDSFFNETINSEEEKLQMTVKFNGEGITQPRNKRNKRFAFLAKFIFSTGVKLIWNLFGFVQQMRLERKVDRLETSLLATQKQSKENYDAIQSMSLEVSSNSIAIDQLQVTTRDLSNRLVQVEEKVDVLNDNVESLTNTQDDMMNLALVESMIDRIEHSTNTGYDTLKDIIHSSLLGQTSPLLLPTEQIQLVQNEVRKVSTGLLDTDFAKMQSIIVSDPSDPHFLLVVINVAALSRKEGELVKLVPIPQFESSKTYQPALDYDTIIIDQLSQKYFILNEQEEYDCLFNRCYISDVERPIDQKTCGIPQLFDQQMDACVFEETPSSGVFIKPMLPDGIIFAFKDEVSTQLFCKDNSDIGAVKKLDGSGIMQLPNGCILSVTDKLGKNTKVRGQPLYRVIDAEDLTLVMNGPLAGIRSYFGENSTQKKETTDGLITSQLNPVVQQVEEVDAKVEHHSSFIWGMIGILAVTTILIIAIIMVIYKRSQKFFGKVRFIRERFDDVHKQITRLNNLRHRVTDGLHHPQLTHLRHTLGHPTHSIKTRLGWNTQAQAPPQEDEASIYVSMHNVPQPMKRITDSTNKPLLSSLRFKSQEKEVPKVPYPDLNNSQLDEQTSLVEEENRQVEDLCRKYRRNSLV